MPTNSSRSEMTPSSFASLVSRTSTRTTTQALLQSLSGDLPLLFKEWFEIQVAQIGADREVGLKLRRIGIQTATCVDHLMSEDDPGLIERHQIDLAPGSLHYVGPESQKIPKP